MADYQLVIIGGGLSGLAAGIRAARFGLSTLIVEQHFRPGGLNSWYNRQGFLLETGLHAMTNYAPPGAKRAPLNRLFRQLKLSRKKFTTRQQLCSEIRFPHHSLLFSNELELLESQVAGLFPAAIDRFQDLLVKVREYDPFTIRPWRSTRAFLAETLANPLLEDMLLLPLMVYGNSEEGDMDLGQFVIMFQAIFLEGFFRPQATIKEFLQMLVAHYQGFGGELRYSAPVAAILRDGERACGVRLADGSEITAETVLSTAGIPATAELSGWDLPEKDDYVGQMSFMESINILPTRARQTITHDRTIIFYNEEEKFSYLRPRLPLDISWGVICFPENFSDCPASDHFQVRVTNAANYDLWQGLDPAAYAEQKQQWQAASQAVVSKIIGNYQGNSVYSDAFTPVTIQRFTAKAAGAVYGSPKKIADGATPFAGLFIAGTDQGFLGIVGAMLSGVSMVNRHVLG
ncbi:MAG: FAD-dependent oxidoreductase [Thermodesulfobacteriota bacterium]